MRTAINAIIIKDKKLLLTKKNETWILPGGKPNENETDLDCLKREVAEELSNTKIKNIRFYSNFQGITPHKGDIIETHAYFCDLDGTLNKTSAEILDVKFVNDFENYNLSDTTKKIVEKLKIDIFL